MQIPKHQVDNIIVTGKSGAGKQPRIDVLVKELGLKQLSTGVMFRELMAQDTELAKEVKNYVNNGQLVPDELTNNVFAEFFKKHNCSGFILDGYPRTIKQAGFLLKLLEENNSKVNMVIEVHREDDQILKHVQGRMICKKCNSTHHIKDRPPREGNLCQDCDGEVFKRDDESAIKNRLDYFHTSITPMILHLKEKGLAHARVDGYLNPWSKERVKSTVFDALSTAVDLNSNIYFITGNENKFKEAKEILPELDRVEIDLPEIQSIDSKKVIKAKLKEAFKHHAGPFIVEDVSVSFDCLNGLPGPLIKWFLKTIGNQGMYDLVEKYNNNKSTVTCSIGYAKDPENIEFFQADVKGQITAPTGTGFGWDPIFKPAGADKTYGEMSAEEKNNISMRKLALSKLKQHLENNNE